MAASHIKNQLFQVAEEDREAEDTFYAATKRPSTGLDSIKSASSAFSNQTWRINSTAGEFFDEQFVGSPNLNQGPLLLSHHPSAIHSQNLKDLDSSDFNSTITPSVSARSHNSIDTQSTQKTEETNNTSADLGMISFPPPPSTNADSPLMPIMTDFPSIGPKKLQNPETPSDRQKRLADLRARQHALFLEQQALEMEKTPKQQYESRFGSQSLSVKHSPPSDTDMQDGMNLTLKNVSKSHSPARSSRKRLAPLPPQQSLPPIPTPVTHLEVDKLTKAEKSPYQNPQDDHHRSTEDIASDFEMASLRAQVAQLQLALKKQMSPMSHPVTSNKREEPMNLYEISGMPSTSAESRSGSSDRALSRAPSRLGVAAQNSERHHLMHLEHHGSILDDFSPRMPASSISPTQHDRLHQQRGVSGANSIRSYSNQSSSINNSSHRSGSANLHRQESFARTHDTFGNSFAMSTGSGNSAGQSSRYGSNEPSLFSHRSVIPDESASSFSRPSTSDERRVDELSAKIDRLEELLRLTSMQHQNRPIYDEYSSTVIHPQNTEQGRPHNNEVLHESKYLPPHYAEDQRERYMSQDELARHRSVESEVLIYPRMQQQHFTQEQQHQHHQEPHLYNRTPSLASSATSQAAASTRTKSPAASAFQFNATSYSHSEQANQLGIGRTGKAPSMHSTTSKEGNENNDEKMTIMMTKSDTQIEHIRRKGVARFILGSATTKLLDSHGGAIPSSQVSLSRNRTERIEKPKVKVKSAGRGRIVVKQPTKTA